MYFAKMSPAANNVIKFEVEMKFIVAGIDFCICF